jgi:alpha-galactosidase
VINATEDGFVMVKDLEDGSMAVGLCNKADWPAQITVTWSDLGVSGRQKVRDLWRQRAVGVFEDAYTATVPARFVHTLRITQE